MAPDHQDAFLIKKFLGDAISLMLGVVHRWRFVDIETSKNSYLRCSLLNIVNIVNIVNIAATHTNVAARTAFLVRPERAKRDAKNTFVRVVCVRVADVKIVCVSQTLRAVSARRYNAAMNTFIVCST